MTHETLLIEDAGDGVIVVALNRPAAGNSLSTKMALELLALWRQLGEPGAARAIVLTGAGGKIFCAGADLKERDGMTDDQWVDQHRLFEAMRDALVALPVPVICAVNGAAYGGGCEIALNCDFVYAAQGARFALPEVKLGIMPGLGGVQNLARAAGERRAREILLTGDPFTAEEGAGYGVVNRVCAPADLVPEAVATACKIAGNAPLSIRNIRRTLDATRVLSGEAAIKVELEHYDALTPTDDRREGVAAWGEKRKPDWKGR
ncbi:enoyl-CoA hydratase/isomerase family protein [Caulobacter mirabilis]|uniref:Enoyl-CoA hydratase n=1 Tax=Caulobacter mirabilis TaxID=69666 RepID=A0A2D2B3Q0_9CAUL|nr:enoyl-CoA hydratase-related protein [Caulobacter mirabilis]ATQ44889.1 enoyl-CoA hydratase [Caulobacter mirabilis]